MIDEEMCSSEWSSFFYPSETQICRHAHPNWLCCLVAQLKSCRISLAGIISGEVEHSVNQSERYDNCSQHTDLYENRLGVLISNSCKRTFITSGDLLFDYVPEVFSARCPAFPILFGQTIDPYDSDTIDILRDLVIDTDEGEVAACFVVTEGYISKSRKLRHYSCEGLWLATREGKVCQRTKVLKPHVSRPFFNLIIDMKVNLQSRHD